MVFFKSYILIGVLVILTHYPAAIDGAVTLNKHPKLVVFSFDGFRFDYLTKAKTPTLNALKAAGVTTPYMTPQFTSKTFTNHQSIVTGLYPESHGIMDNDGYDPLYDSVVSGYKDEERFWYYSPEVLPIWLVNEMGGEGRISGAQFPGSGQAYGPNRKRISHSLDYKNKTTRPYKERMDIVVNWLTHDTQPANLVFMYFDEPDTQGHRHGPHSHQVREAVEELDTMMAYFLKKLDQLEIRDEINLMIVSDHGMEEVKNKNIIPLGKLADPSIAYKRCGGSPLLHIWPKEEDTAGLYEQFLTASKTQPFSVFKGSDLPTRWHYKRSRRVAPILLLADPGFKFNEKWGSPCLSSADHTGDEVVTNPEVTGGFHGYDNESPSMRAFFLAAGPLFRKGGYIEPFENVDLYPFICKLINVPAPPNNGTITRVLPALIGEVKDSAVRAKVAMHFISATIPLILGKIFLV